MANLTYTEIMADRGNSSLAEELLLSLTRRHVARSIPLLCFICLLMLVGLCGNALVIVTYIRRLEKSSTNLFIFCLAVFDIVNCCISLPMEVTNLLNPFENDHSFLCKTHAFIERIADASSGFIILCISFDRYLRIARPHQGLSVKGSKIAIGLVCTFALILSSLALYVSGTEIVTFEGHPDLVGYKCGTSESAKDTVVPLLFRTLILVCFGIGVIVLLTVYTLLGVKVRKWNRDRKNKHLTSCRRSDVFSQTTFSDDTESRDDSHTENACSNQPEMLLFLQKSETLAEYQNNVLQSSFQRPEYVRELSRSLEGNHFMRLDGVHMSGTKTLPLRKSESFKNRQAAFFHGRKGSMPSVIGLRKRIKISRTTIMFIAATIAFVASHIPYACTKIALTVHRDLLNHMSDVGISFFKFAEFSFVVSYAANPVIYSFLNPKYRREFKKLLHEVKNTIKCKSKQFYL